MIFDHAFVLPRSLASGKPLHESTLEAADLFSARLAEAGFVEGSSRSHPGQGTANRRLFLQGAIIECLFVEDEVALDDARGTVLALGQCFRDPWASGVGIAFRPDPKAVGDLPAPAFASSRYRPAYLPASMHIDVASALKPDVPLLFHLPFVDRGAVVPGDGEPRLHPNGARRPGDLMLERAAALPDSALGVFESAGIRQKTGTSDECLHVQLLGLDHGVELDMRPLFPLRLHA